MSKRFIDDGFREWEAYVSAGAPHTQDAARILFVCISEPGERPRFLRHDSRDPTSAEAELQGAGEDRLLDLFRTSEPLP